MGKCERTKITFHKLVCVRQKRGKKEKERMCKEKGKSTCCGDVGVCRKEMGVGFYPLAEKKGRKR
jgi:hypothetical protein